MLFIGVAVFWRLLDKAPPISNCSNSECLFKGECGCFYCRSVARIFYSKLLPDTSFTFKHLLTKIFQQAE